MQRQRRPQYNAATIVGATPLPSSTRPRRGGTDLVPSYRDARDDANAVMMPTLS